MLTSIRFSTFPLVEGGAAVLLVFLAGLGVSYWPLFPAITAAAIAVLAVLERFFPL